MNKLIYKVNERMRYFSILVGKVEEFYYLPKRLATLFMSYLQEGVLVDFVLASNVKKIGKINAKEISYFKKIEDKSKKKKYFDLERLRQEMFEVLGKFENLMFLDFEMTMPYKKGTFSPQIIQAGYVITNNNGKTLEKKSIYIMPLKKADYNYRTEAFLKVPYDKFLRKAVDFDVFYEDIKKDFQKYNPQIVVWGKSDYSVLVKNLVKKEKEIFFDRNNFSNLLQIYRNYYQIGLDVGLFDAYKQTVNGLKYSHQKHNALDDAIMTKEVYFSFYDMMKKNYLQND